MRVSIPCLSALLKLQMAASESIGGGGTSSILVRSLRGEGKTNGGRKNRSGDDKEINSKDADPDLMQFMIEGLDNGAKVNSNDFGLNWLLPFHTDEPTSSPSSSPTPGPTPAPTSPPSSSPTTESLTSLPPSSTPTAADTGSPSGSPTEEPTPAPTSSPSASPTTSPTTLAPSGEPTTTDPTFSPTFLPTNYPTGVPTITESAMPSEEESDMPSADPTTESPTSSPSMAPVTGSPTMNPSMAPVTGSPTMNPSMAPVTGSPTTNPSMAPVTGSPTKNPSMSPVTGSPTTNPSMAPVTGSPTTNPSMSPVTGSPTMNPSLSPVTGSPTSSPSMTPVTGSPTMNPTISPTTDSPTIISSAANIETGSGADITPSQSNGPTNAPSPVSFAGIVWNDANENGIIDSAESGVFGVTIQAKSCGTDRTVAVGFSMSDGSYRLRDIGPAGCYYLIFLPGADYIFTVPTSGQTDYVELESGENGSFDAGILLSPTDSPVTDGPTAQPSEQPVSYSPTATPSSMPSKSPTGKPTTESPTIAPSDKPTVMPSGPPTISASDAPSSKPTGAPTPSPSSSPITVAPTSSPTPGPTTDSPTVGPSTSPSNSPSKQPATNAPTDFPTQIPTTGPITQPSDSPTTAHPATDSPTKLPSASPFTSSPTANPTTQPVTDAPVAHSDSSLPALAPRPTTSPTPKPVTAAPVAPSDSALPVPATPTPTTPPSSQPVIDAPTMRPTQAPVTDAPTVTPTNSPTQEPTTNPTDAPSPVSTLEPSSSPSLNQSVAPSISPNTSAITEALPTSEPSVSVPTASPITTVVSDLPRMKFTLFETQGALSGGATTDLATRVNMFYNAKLADHYNGDETYFQAIRFIPGDQSVATQQAAFDEPVRHLRRLTQGTSVLFDGTVEFLGEAPPSSDLTDVIIEMSEENNDELVSSIVDSGNSELSDVSIVIVAEDIALVSRVPSVAPTSVEENFMRNPDGIVGGDNEDNNDDGPDMTIIIMTIIGITTLTMLVFMFVTRRRNTGSTGEFNADDNVQSRGGVMVIETNRVTKSNVAGDLNDNAERSILSSVTDWNEYNENVTYHAGEPVGSTLDEQYEVEIGGDRLQSAAAINCVGTMSVDKEEKIIPKSWLCALNGGGDNESMMSMSPFPEKAGGDKTGEEKTEELNVCQERPEEQDQDVSDDDSSIDEHAGCGWNGCFPRSDEGAFPTRLDTPTRQDDPEAVNQDWSHIGTVTDDASSSKPSAARDLAQTLSHETDASKSSLNQFISDLVWLEKKISDENAKGTTGSKSKQESHIGSLAIADSYSYECDEFSPRSNSDEESTINSGVNSQEAMSIVCRDCYIPPGNLDVEIASTKDGPVIKKLGDKTLGGHLNVGDLIMALDDNDTRSLSAEAMAKALSSKAGLQRKLTLLHFGGMGK